MTLFGITHTQKEYEAAEFILKSKPKFVVCETAVSAGHGEQHGNVVMFEQGVQQMMINPELDEALTFVTRLTAEMKSEVDKDVLVGDFWLSVREQLPCGTYGVCVAVCTWTRRLSLQIGRKEARTEVSHRTNVRGVGRGV